MKNKVIECKPTISRLGSYRKEKAGLYRQYTVLNLDRPDTDRHGVVGYAEPIIIRVYWPAQTAYACVWLSGPIRNSYAMGKGKAGGCGYCKESAAVDAALRDAGYILEQSIHGAGHSAIIGAIKAVAEWIGLTNWTIVEAHA